MDIKLFAFSKITKRVARVGIGVFLLFSFTGFFIWYQNMEHKKQDNLHTLKNQFRQRPYFCSRRAKYYLENIILKNFDTDETMLLPQDVVIDDASFLEEENLALISVRKRDYSGKFLVFVTQDYLFDLKTKKAIYNIKSGILNFTQDVFSDFFVAKQEIHPYKKILTICDYNNIYTIDFRHGDPIIKEIYQVYSGTMDFHFDDSGKFIVILLKNSILFYDIQKGKFTFNIEVKRNKDDIKFLMYKNDKIIQTLLQLHQKELSMLYLTKNNSDKVIVQCSKGLLSIDAVNGQAKYYYFDILQQRIDKIIFFRHFMILKYKFFKEEFYMYDLNSLKQVKKFRDFVKDAINIQTIKNDSLKITYYDGSYRIFTLKELR